MYKSSSDFIKLVNQVYNVVNWIGLEYLLLRIDTENLKGWNKTDSTAYSLGNAFRRSINGISVKFITIQVPTEQYEEPWDAPQCFRPIQYSFDSELKPIVCNWVKGEYLIRNCHRVCPITNKTYWMKLDTMESSDLAPSEARALDPKTWGEV